MINCLRGSVTVRVESAYPERVVNLCAAHAIPFWDLRWIDGATFTVRTSLGALPRLQAVTQQVDCSVTVVRRTGLPILLLSLRRRYVLLAGAALLLLFLFGGNLFIWDFQVTGNETVPTETILRTLEEYAMKSSFT